VGQDRPGGRLAAGVAYLGGPVSHDKNHLVAQLLELAQFTKTHHMAQVNVRPAGVEAHLQAQGLSLLQHADELVVGDDFLDATTGYLGNDLFAKHY